MLQHAAVDQPAIPGLALAARSWTEMATLERRVNEAVESLRLSRPKRARSRSFFSHMQAQVDAWLRTDKPEYLDEANLAPERRVAIVQALHLFNKSVFAYRRFYRELKPWLQEIHTTEGRPARVLELASGSGEFSLTLADLAQRDGLAVEVTGSDYFAEHVVTCNAKAVERALPVTFIEANAFDLSDIPVGTYDIIFIAQSSHHFSPGQNAVMIAQATKIATLGFISIDGQRSVLLFALPAIDLFIGGRDFTHDSIISLRKFYTHSELELIANIAVPNGIINVRPVNPGYSLLTVFS